MVKLFNFKVLPLLLLSLGNNLFGGVWLTKEEKEGLSQKRTGLITAHDNYCKNYGKLWSKRVFVAAKSCETPLFAAFSSNMKTWEKEAIINTTLCLFIKKNDDDDTITTVLHEALTSKNGTKKKLEFITYLFDTFLDAMKKLINFESDYTIPTKLGCSKVLISPLNYLVNEPELINNLALIDAPDEDISLIKFLLSQNAAINMYTYDSKTLAPCEPYALQTAIWRKSTDLVEALLENTNLTNITADEQTEMIGFVNRTTAKSTRPPTDDTDNDPQIIILKKLLFEKLNPKKSISSSSPSPSENETTDPKVKTNGPTEEGIGKDKGKAPEETKDQYRLDRKLDKWSNELSTLLGNEFTKTDGLRNYLFTAAHQRDFDSFQRQLELIINSYKKNRIELEVSSRATSLKI